MSACHLGFSVFVPKLSSSIISRLNLEVHPIDGVFRFRNSRLEHLPPGTWVRIAKERGVTSWEMKKTSWLFSERFHTSFTAADLVFGRSLLLYFLSHDKELQPEECLRVLELAANRGNEKAIATLLKAYKYGYFGLNRTSQNVRRKGLQLAKQYAAQGSEEAIRLLLDAYRFDFFGL